MAGIKRWEGGQIEQKGDGIVEGHAKSQIIDGLDWEVSLGVEVVEAFADGVGEAEVLEVGHLVEVEGEDVAAIDEAEIGALLHAAAGPDEGADEEEKQTEGDDEEAGHGLICG